MGYVAQLLFHAIQLAGQSMICKWALGSLMLWTPKWFTGTVNRYI